jgi:monoamine oxidase
MKEVAIVGGGPGGLFAAYMLDQKSSKKLNVTLFEASERVGGKIHTSQFSSVPILYEAGAAELYGYAHLGPDPLWLLIKSLGLGTVEMAGRTVVLGDRIMRSDADIKRHFGRKTLKAIEEFRNLGNSMLSPKEYYDSGWPDDNHHPWARRSFKSLLAKVPTRAARRYLQTAVHSDLAIEPHLATGLFGLENCLMDDRRYVRLYSIQGGIERLARCLQARISAQIELNSRVVRVEKTRLDKYRIYFRNNQETQARDFDSVALALPNYWLEMIEWGGSRLSRAMAEHQHYYDRPAHYLRITILFRRPFWRNLISGSYFQLGAFGGCCVYDEGTKHNAGSYGVLSWLLSGSAAMIMSNHQDEMLFKEALDSLPGALAGGRELFLEGHVHRWVGMVNAQPGGYPIKGARSRHFPEPKEHPGLLVIGDYLFDSTINGVLDSADIATDLTLRFLGIRRREAWLRGSINAKERGPYLLPDPTAGELHAATMANTGRHWNKNS